MSAHPAAATTGAVYTRPLPFDRRASDRRIEVFSPKLGRRLSLTSYAAWQLWLALEANPAASLLCERSAFIDGAHRRTIDFWVRFNRQDGDEFWLLDDAEQAADDTASTKAAEQSAWLMTAHRAKGMEYRHVIVMDCADWRWSGEDERWLLYVAMTRARETLTVMRAEGGRNSYLVDLGTVDGVIDLLPSSRPEYRNDIDRRYVTLGPADVDIGFAGRHNPDAPVHRHIASLIPGDEVIVSGRHVKTRDGELIGKLGAKTARTTVTVSGTVSGCHGANA